MLSLGNISIKASSYSLAQPRHIDQNLLLGNAWQLLEFLLRKIHLQKWLIARPRITVDLEMSIKLLRCHVEYPINQS